MASTTSAAPGLYRKRQKLTSTACEPCRSRKIRCDGNKPTCEACSKRSQQCVYHATPDIKSANAYVDSLVSRVAQLEQELNNARTTILRLSTTPGVPAEPQSPQPPPHPQQPLSNIDPRLLPDYERSAAQHGSVDAMGGGAGIDTVDDGQTFYGSSSALGFTRQMYGSILQKDPNISEFGTTEVASSAHEVSSSSTVAYMPPDTFSLFPRELSDRLLSLYWKRVHILYPFLHEDSFNRAYEDLWKPSFEHHSRTNPSLGLGASKESGPSSVVFHCALNAALALAMHFSDLPLSERERLSSACLAKSKQLLRLNLFDDGNIALVQTLLLLTQYFQSTTWPNKCWTSIGLACRLAQGLGLHIEEDRLKQSTLAAESEIRRRVWHGCVTMDIIVSMTLGRPAMLVGTPARSLPRPLDGFNEALIVDGGDTLFSIDFFTETVKLYRIVGRILLNIYKIHDEPHTESGLAGDNGKEEVVRAFEADLARFRREIPDKLLWKSSAERKQNDESNDTALSQSHVLHVRVLHAHILLLRPIFLHFCRANMSGNGDGLPIVGTAPTDDENYGFRCALSCVRTSLELIDSVKVYSATDMTGAWWYNVFYTRTAAMVVLLSAVCPPICDILGQTQWQEAWTSCVEILTKNLPQYKSVRACLATLSALRQNILNQRSEVGLPGPSSERAAEPVVADGQDALANGAIPGQEQFLFDPTFDPFTFIESELYSDFGFDLTQALV
ncbi:hypothetical protein OPT61_g10123 [Boeremia exigua]|uniref:Uncharacterized protein n=1 Tax=Boeremia exigua TaxID=749465 RepID=A0ACC2HRC4_9PLEO|nr:hypothetical protein OPT61_g10123 [Boeremia exigua]